MINLGENPAPDQIPAQYVSGNPTPRPEPGWGAVKQAHDDLAFKLENESLLAPLHGAIAEQTINAVLSSLGWADAADPGGIADIIDSVFGTAAGHRSLDDGAPTSQQ